MNRSFLVKKQQQNQCSSQTNDLLFYESFRKTLHFNEHAETIVSRISLFKNVMFYDTKC